MMKKHSMTILVHCLLWLAAPVYAASFNLEANDGAPLYRSDVPLEVYQSSRQDDLGDITIANAANERVPHVVLEKSLVHPPAQAVDKLLALPVFTLPVDALHYSSATGAQELKIQLEKTTSNTTVSISQGATGAPANSLYLLDAGEKHLPIHKLTLDWTQADANMMAMEVLASDDLNNWASVGRGVLLKTGNAAGSIVQNTITLDTPTTARYLQLRHADHAQALTLTSAQAHLSTVANAPPRLLWQALANAKRNNDSSTGKTSIEFEAMGHYPAEFIRINLAEDNTIAAVRIAVRNHVDEPWRALTTASLYRMTEKSINGQSNSLTNPDIAIPPTVARYWQLQFSQATGGIGGSNPGLALGWPVQTVVWNARGSGPFILQTGTPAANQVTIESLIPDFKPEKLKLLPVAVISLKDGAGNIAQATSASSWTGPASPEDKKRWWLWGGLVLGVLILAGMAVSLLKSSGNQSSSKQDS